MALIKQIKIGETTYDVGVNLGNVEGTLGTGNGGTGLTSLVTPTVTWAAGSSAGPTLKIKDSLNKTSSAVAIPSASSSASGIITTGSQTLAGQKTFTSTLVISDSCYPSFELHPTTINSSTNTYPKGVFEGSTYDNVSMWIWGDKTNSAKSRRGLVLYNYSAQSSANNALALRQCDTSGNWQSDLYILHSGNFASFITPSSIGAAASSHNHSASNITSGTLPIARGGTEATTKQAAWANLIPCYTSPWTSTADDTGDNWASLGNSTVTWWPDSNNGIYGKPSTWGLVFTVSAAPAGSQELHQLWFSQANGAIYHRGGNGQTASSMEANSWAKLWQSGDSITGAVWNDYAEYRETDCEEFGRVLMEKGDDTLTTTTERLSHFAGVSSDTWGFCQGETAKAKTPIAVAGRVLVYPYQNRKEYKPGDCVCAAPNGTVDIMTREEIINYPDRIVGTVSCVPEYETWGSGDRDPVIVNGRIWIKVR